MISDVYVIEEGVMKHAQPCGYNGLKGCIICVEYEHHPRDFVFADHDYLKHGYSFLVTYRRAYEDTRYKVCLYPLDMKVRIDELIAEFGGTFRENVMRFNIDADSDHMHPLNMFRVEVNDDDLMEG
jgi:hypothetical protein